MLINKNLKMPYNKINKHIAILLIICNFLNNKKKNSKTWSKVLKIVLLKLKK